MAEEIECPVCESSIPSDSDKCPECGVDLSLFDIDVSEASIESEEDIKEIMDKLTDEDEDLEFINELKSIDDEDIQDVEGIDKVREAVEDEAEDEVLFECPVCEAEVSEEDSECPQCGAIFEEDEEVEEEEVEEEEVEEEEVEYDGLSKDELEEKLTEARKSLSEARKSKIKVDDIKSLMVQGIKNKKDGELIEAKENFEDVVKWSKKVADLYGLIIDAKGGIKELKEKGIDYKDHLKELKKIKEKADKGNYTAAEEMIENLSEQIQTELEKTEEAPKKKEEDETEEEESKEEFREKLSTLKKRVAKVRDTNVDVEPLKSLISDIKEIGVEGDFEKALNKVEDLDQMFEKVLEADEKIIALKDRIEELEEEGHDTKKFEDELEKAIGLADKGDYESALEAFEGLSGDISDFIKEKEETEAELVAMFEEKLPQTRAMLSDAREYSLDIDPLKNLMRKAVRAGNEGEYEVALEDIDEFYEIYEFLKNISKKLEEGKSLVRELRDNDIRYSRFVKDLKEAKRKSDEGDYEYSLSLLHEVIEDMEEALEEIEQEEELPSPEEIEAEVEAELKETEKDLGSEAEEEIPSEEIEAEIEAELKETEKDLGSEAEEEIPSEEEIEAEIEAEMEKAEDMAVGEETETVITREAEDEAVQEELYMDDIEDLIKELRSLSKTAKENDLSLESGREIIEKAIESTKRDDYETAYEVLSDGKEQIEDEIEDLLEEKIMDIELNVEELEDKDIDVESDISKIRAEMREDRFKRAIELLRSTENKLILEEGPVEEAQRKISQVEKVINDADYVGLDTETAKELLERAKKEKKVGNNMDAENLAEDAKSDILSSLPDFMKDKVSEAQKKLMKAKIVGTDVSKPVDLLKQANVAKKNDDFEECLNYIKMFEEEMRDRTG
ncbi:MAG: hypothetical protein R6W73_06280 [Candidatus Saliniplasma sp.]